MISIEKWYILTPPQKFLRNVRDLGKLIVSKGFKKLPKVQKIARSGHTEQEQQQNIQQTVKWKMQFYGVEWYGKSSMLCYNSWPLKFNTMS